MQLDFEGVYVDPARNDGRHRWLCECKACLDELTYKHRWHLPGHCMSIETLQLYGYDTGKLQHI